MSRPRITALEPSFATGYWNDLFIGVWTGEPTLAATTEWSRQYDNMAARHPGGYLVFVVIEAQTPIPDATVRKALSAVMDRLGSKVRAMAAVQEASGFLGAAVRSVLLALTNISTGPYPRRVFSASDDAVRWLASHGEAPSAPARVAAIAAAVVEFREMLKVGRSGANHGVRAAS